MTSAYVSGWRLRAVIASVVAAAGAYVLVSMLTGLRAVLAGFATAGWGVMVLALALALLNYGLRFARWQFYLRSMQHRVPLLEHARIYLTGFALTTTPGKAGEAIRAVFLHRHGVDYGSTFAAMFSERLSDLVTLLVLCVPGLDLDPRLHLLMLVSAAGALAALGLLAWPGWLGWVAARAAPMQGRVGQLLRHTVHTLRQARRCHAPRLLILSTLLGLAAWSAEAFAFHLLCARLGMHLTLGYAMFVYAASIIVGGVSLVPGGLGGTEAAMVALLLLRGVSLPQAVAATLLIRLATLWFAVALGMAALWGLRGPGLRVR
jgi:uncharacterized membrane protein YbhN (UPF0104 family)